MTKKIFRSILLAAVSVLLASLVIIMGCLYGYYRDVQEKQLRDELRLAGRGVEAGGNGYLEQLASPYRFPSTADFRLTWIDPDGKVLFDTHVPASEMENHADRAEVRQARAEGESGGVRYSETLTERTMYCAQRLADGTVLRISISQLTVFALALGMLQPILLTAILAVVLSALLAHRMAKSIVAPLNRLDLDRPLEKDAYEELSPLLGRLHQQHRQIEAQLRELAAAEHSRREFTANVSHELKTPLQSIMGSAELLENGLVRPEDIPQFVGVIRTEAARLVTLVEDIIHLSQLDEGMAPAKEPVDLLELARDAASALRERAEERHICLSVTGGQATVTGVRSFLYEMLYNLIDNAIKYNVDGGKAEVVISADDTGAVVSVRDTGIGIPPEYQARVFERFFRVDKSRSKASGGTGLGLSIVKHIAQYHHAGLDLHSAMGEGTDISVIFPKEHPKIILPGG